MFGKHWHCIFLDDVDYLDPSQFSFRPGFRTEAAFVALVNYLGWELDTESASLGSAGPQWLLISFFFLDYLVGIGLSVMVLWLHS